jgi:hypothetical protein
MAVTDKHYVGGGGGGDDDDDDVRFEIFMIM